MNTIKAYMVPPGFVLLGTCGSCGGPVLTLQVVCSNGTGEPIYAACTDCKRQLKVEVTPNYGPVLEMR